MDQEAPGTAGRGSDILIRPLAAADLDAALMIQREAYPEFLREDREAFASRLSIPFSYCLAASCGSELIGYLLSHGWPSRHPPSVGTVLTGDREAEILFIHDLATSSAVRGRGLGKRLVEDALASASADGFRSAELIAVEGAADFWQALGFRHTYVTDELALKVAGYGPRAAWMERSIGGVVALRGLPANG